jgi:hypothetical protein
MKNSKHFSRNFIFTPNQSAGGQVFAAEDSVLKSSLLAEQQN